MAKGDATERRARQRRAPDGADKAQLASAWAAAGHLPKLTPPARQHITLTYHASYHANPHECQWRLRRGVSS